MPANNRKALVLRFPGAIRKADDPEHPSQRNNSDSTDREIRKPDAALPFAEAKFRQCSADRWSHSAWSEWFRWAKAVHALEGGDYFGSAESVDSRFSVRWSDTKTLGETVGALHSDQAVAILEELGLDDLVAGFDEFWEVIHAAIQYPLLTPAALRKDAEIYGGALGLAGRLEEAKVLLRQKGLLR